MSDLWRAEALRDDICKYLPEAEISAVEGNKWAAALLGYKTYEKMLEFVRQARVNDSVADSITSEQLMKNPAKLWNLILYLTFMDMVSSKPSVAKGTGAPLDIIAARYGLSSSSIEELAAWFNMEIQEVSIEGESITVLRSPNIECRIPNELPDELNGDKFVQYLVMCSNRLGIPITKLTAHAMYRGIIPESIWICHPEVATHVTQELLRTKLNTCTMSVLKSNIGVSDGLWELLKFDCLSFAGSRAYIRFSAANMLMLPANKLAELVQNMCSKSKAFVETTYGLEYDTLNLLRESYMRDPKFAQIMDWNDDMREPTSYAFYYNTAEGDKHD